MYTNKITTYKLAAPRKAFCVYPCCHAKDEPPVTKIRL